MSCMCTPLIQEPTHCCLGFEQLHKTYYPHTRLYELPDGTVINFCPCCGHQLPENLRKEWKFDLRARYNVDPDHASVWNPMVPEEYKTDAWWKNKGL